MLAFTSFSNMLALKIVKLLYFQQTYQFKNCETVISKKKNTISSAPQE